MMLDCVPELSVGRDSDCSNQLDLGSLLDELTPSELLEAKDLSINEEHIAWEADNETPGLSIENLVPPKAERPGTKDVEEALKICDKQIDDPLARDFCKAIITGDVERISNSLWLNFDENNNGKERLEKVVEELNKHLEHPVELVVETQGGTTRYGLKFTCYDRKSESDSHLFEEKHLLTVMPHGRYTAEIYQLNLDKLHPAGGYGGYAAGNPIESITRLQNLAVAGMMKRNRQP